MASATQRALAERAIRAANLMEIWRGRVEEEMTKQNITRFASGTETVMLKAKMLNAMFSGMSSLIDEIRGFERNLRSQKIQALRHPSN